MNPAEVPRRSPEENDWRHGRNDDLQDDVPVAAQKRAPHLLQARWRVAHGARRVQNDDRHGHDADDEDLRREPDSVDHHEQRDERSKGRYLHDDEDWREEPVEP